MSEDHRRSHAWLPRPKGERGEPFLPEVGELYLINTLVYSVGDDPAADRPVVVLCVPPNPASRSPIQVVTRTSQVAKGIRHPADRKLGLDRDGTFSDLANIELQLWTPKNVLKLGVLPEPYLSLVIRRFS